MWRRACHAYLPCVFIGGHGRGKAFVYRVRARGDRIAGHGAAGVVGAVDVVDVVDMVDMVDMVAGRYWLARKFSPARKIFSRSTRKRLPSGLFYGIITKHQRLI